MNLTRNDIYNFLRASVHEPQKAAKWSIQGFGMLRMHLQDDWRLSVWHPDYAVVGVSDIHDHPWNFTSYVLNGTMKSHIYQVPFAGKQEQRAERYHGKEIKPGTGLEVVRQLPDTMLAAMHTHVCSKGQSYRQVYHELHRSEFTKGCVTLIKRDRSGRPDLARTFWPQGTTWVSAEPREATTDEVVAMCTAALSYWQA